jgi:hypothetical protein
MKILTTVQVRELAAAAKAAGFDRYPSDSVLEHLADGTFQIAVMSIWNNVRTSHPDDTMHHRVRLALRTTGSRGPVPGWLDITDEDWAALPDRDAVLAEVRSQD